jgi:hypothetical protein
VTEAEFAADMRRKGWLQDPETGSWHKAPRMPRGTSLDKAAILSLSKPPKPPISNLEEKFSMLWIEAGGPTLEREVPLIPGRLFRVDFLHDASKTVIEIEGFGIGHVSKKGFKKDADKYLELTMMGYTLFRLTRHLITESNILRIIGFIKREMYDENRA